MSVNASPKREPASPTGSAGTCRRRLRKRYRIGTGWARRREISASSGAASTSRRPRGPERAIRISAAGGTARTSSSTVSPRSSPDASRSSISRTRPSEQETPTTSVWRTISTPAAASARSSGSITCVNAEPRASQNGGVGSAAL